MEKIIIKFTMITHFSGRMQSVEELRWNIGVTRKMVVKIIKIVVRFSKYKKNLDISGILPQVWNRYFFVMRVSKQKYLIIQWKNHKFLSTNIMLICRTFFPRSPLFAILCATFFKCFSWRLLRFAKVLKSLSTLKRKKKAEHKETLSGELVKSKLSYFLEYRGYLPLGDGRHQLKALDLYLYQIHTPAMSVGVGWECRAASMVCSTAGESGAGGEAGADIADLAWNPERDCMEDYPVWCVIFKLRTLPIVAWYAA